ncbi:MAG: phospho-N-acetylmuramoyl-pentapeptide-transferase, partial [Oscillospiraceae bacterium]|nr:phospho-N-acetylmuramoyl-pentapeptide-transferase [Candidatus Equicaccousia limihippi]
MDFSPLIAAVVGFVIAYLLGFIVVPYLKNINFGQTIREVGPSWHQSKNGTPTMGGIIFIAASLVAFGVAIGVKLIISGNLGLPPHKLAAGAAAVGLALCMSIIGFIDDYIKVVKKRNLGLTARQKTFLQLLVSAAFLVTLFISGNTYTYIPFAGEVDVSSGIGLIYWPIALFFVYGFVNAVNLTDGVDGLATSVTVVLCAMFVLLSSYYNLSCLWASAIAGGLLGFLIWNAHPAKVFMGDTGSLFLGGAVVGISFFIDRPIYLILAGFIYLAEALSVVLQVAYFKKTKKRLFKMSPIHHHFEMCGWSEEKIV